MARRPLRKVTYFEPVASRVARNTVIESTFEVGRRFRCTMRVDCSEIDPGAVIRPVPGEWQPHMPAQLDEEQLADWRAGRAAVYPGEGSRGKISINLPPEPALSCPVSGTACM